MDKTAELQRDKKGNVLYDKETGEAILGSDGKSITNSVPFKAETVNGTVEVPFIKNSHRYFLVKTRASESKRGDQFSIMVNRPVLGDNPVVPRYSWFNYGSMTQATIIADSSVVRFDQKDDSTWTADLSLYAPDCRSGKCIDTLPNLHITGRLRYWVDPDAR